MHVDLRQLAQLIHEAVDQHQAVSEAPQQQGCTASCCGNIVTLCVMLALLRKEKKRKVYAFWRQFNEKPSIIPGCPGLALLTCFESNTAPRCLDVTLLQGRAVAPVMTC